MDNCFGQGYQIPITTDNNTRVECKRYFQMKGECVDPLEPNISVNTNSIVPECRNVTKKELNVFRTKPTECKLNPFTNPFTKLSIDEKKKLAKQICYKRGNKLYYKQKRTIKIPPIPSGDPNMCPPFVRNFDNSIKLDANGNLMREPVEKEMSCGAYISMDEFTQKPLPPSTMNMKTILLICAMIIIMLVIVFVIKKV